VKFKLDENMPADLGELLRDSGHDVEDVLGEYLGGRPDRPVLAAASSESRILITFDLDFADIRQYPPGSDPPTITFPHEWGGTGMNDKPLGSNAAEIAERGLRRARDPVVAAFGLTTG
jgi:hypothetical protein